MLYYKHLHPWLLIYLVLCSALVLLDVGVVVIVKVNKINGVIDDYPVYDLLSVCPMYSYLKIEANGESVMTMCFVMSIIGGVLAAGQLGFVIYQFVMFRRFVQQNHHGDDEHELFKQLSTKKLIALYVVNSLGLMCVIPMVGSLLSFYVELKFSCQQPQTALGQVYFVPFILAGILLLCQFTLFIFTLKFFYHNNHEEQVNNQPFEQPSLTKHQQQLTKMQAAKKKILQSRKMSIQQQQQQPKSSDRSNYNTHYNQQNSTQQQTPRDIQSELLDKKMRENDPFNNRNMGRMQGTTIYHNNNDDDNNENNNTWDNVNIDVYSNNNKNTNNNKKRNMNSMRRQLSPDSISRKQKQLMKTLPKHPFKKANSIRFGPNEVIFEESYSEENGSMQYRENTFIEEDQNNYQSVCQDDKKGKPEYQATQHVNNNQQGNKQSQHQKPKQHPKLQTLSMSQTFRQRYQNSPYLKHLQNKNITPQQRRKIKRPHLKLNSQLIQIDAQNDFLTFTFHPSANYGNQQGMKGQNNKSHQQRQQTPKSKTKQQSQLPQTPRQLRNLSKSRSTTYYIQKSFFEGKGHQDQNPIQNYVNDDENHEDEINKILEFEKISKKRRMTFAKNPFFPFNNQDDPGKLYLHKNNYNAGNYNKNDLLFDDQEEEGYDPFRDQAYDNENLTYRGLMGEDELRSSGSKSTNKNDTTTKRSSTKDLQYPSTAKKPNSRKDAQLLEFIRSKHVVD